MRKIVIALAAVLVVTSVLFVIFHFAGSETAACQKEQKPVSEQKFNGPVDSTWLICEGHIGKIEINLDIEKLQKIFGQENIEEKTVSSEGEGSKMFSVTVGGLKEALLIEPLCVDVCLVSRIFVNSDKYKTKEGIGVGTTFADLKKVYTVKSLTGNENGGIFVQTDQFTQTEFEFRPAGVKTHPGKTHNVLEIPDNTKISMVYMY